MPEPHAFSNRLMHESSPYLRQHAHNPVDWYAWGAEALDAARRLNRPIFLSIGYSACHWCHVMEHESFENEDVARLLNEHFISIKVDREERPDLDQIYMAAVQMLTGSGGWPMSVFLTPDLKPFTGGTYFPPEDRYGRAGFKRVLTTVAEWWRSRRADVSEAAAQITEQIRHLGQLPAGGGELSDSLLRSALNGLARSFDPMYGGFGGAPKFPHSMDLRLLLRMAKRFGDEQALHMARFTLERMALGGIYDHLGGGFARYSTDARWFVPHFEKMLYDNALLIDAYVEAYQATGDPFFRTIVEETLGWVLREMSSAEGPFSSTLDADSEGLEGKYYVWKGEEIEKILGPEDAALFSRIYGVEPGGNWDDPAGHGPPQANVLHRSKTWTQSARLEGIDETELRQRLERCRRRLFEVRSKRVRPGLDDKALTAWNGLMIAALARAAQALDAPAYVAPAVRAAEFILKHMRTPEGRLLRTWSPGHAAKLNAYLEDYSFFLDALVSLYEATFDTRWVEEAGRLTQVMMEQFDDPETGGFFFTGRDHETLIARGKDTQDNATPSGASMAATALLRLAKLTGRADLWRRAEAALQAARGLLQGHPLAAGQMLIALDFYLGPVDEIAVIGDPSAAETKRVLRAVRGGFRPHQVTALQAPSASESAKTVPLLAEKIALGAVTTYVCRDFACQAPLVGADEVLKAFGGTEPA
jgi:uncharacterized protein YyaL (SSP411 family)